MKEMLIEYIENVITEYEIMMIQYRTVPEYVMVCSKMIEEMQEVLLKIEEYCELPKAKALGLPVS